MIPIWLSLKKNTPAVFEMINLCESPESLAITDSYFFFFFEKLLQLSRKKLSEDVRVYRNLTARTMCKAVIVILYLPTL